jgi:hypothetical protein
MVQITYDPALLAPGINEQGLVLSFFDAEQSSWISMDSEVDLNKHTLTAWITRLSAFGIQPSEVDLFDFWASSRDEGEYSNVGVGKNSLLPNSRVVTSTTPLDHVEYRECEGQEEDSTAPDDSIDTDLAADRPSLPTPTPTPDDADIFETTPGVVNNPIPAHPWAPTPTQISQSPSRGGGIETVNLIAVALVAGGASLVTGSLWYSRRRR